MFRTHTCGELRKEHENKKVILSGWIDKIRTHGALTFIDLRDRYGITQITLNKNLESDVRRESVIKVEGVVKLKPEPNKNLETGEIEIEADNFEVLSKSKPLPLDENATEDTKLQYRYLDLRNQKLQENLKVRSDVVFHIRNFFHETGFLEIETPLLVRSTPEGARDFLVPSRINKGKFYALPQSPQLYKQILMIAGMDKYYQIARCLRDEDLRADRQPEHTQLDLEMSFVSSDEIREHVEKMLYYVFKKVKNIGIETPFPTFSYKDAMEKYGSDKPDIRFNMFLNNLTEVAKKIDFNVFKEAEEIYTIFVEKDFSRKEIEEYTELVKIYKAKGLPYVKIKNNEFESGISKFLNEELKNKLIEISNKKEGTFFFSADRKKIAQLCLGHLRNQIAKDLKLTNPTDFKFCWVKDFPLFAFNEEENRWEPEHHVFSMPNSEFVDNFEKNPEKVTGNLWDLVMNGWEMSSGSIRVSNPEIQKRLFKFIGLSEEEANEKFGFLIEAYKYGAPVHGGMGIGIDRLVSLMQQTTDIRDVIAFPKNKNAQCPMDGSPNDVDEIQLKELHIKKNF
ncbi:MAG: aspartate--tRNA ligase [Candidatus Woesearchaeota archaeon]